MAERDRYRPHLPAPITSLFPCCQASPLPLLHLAPLHPNCLLAGLPPPSGPSIAARVSFPRWKSEWVTQLKILLTSGLPFGMKSHIPSLAVPFFRTWCSFSLHLPGCGENYLSPVVPGWFLPLHLFRCGSFCLRSFLLSFICQLPFILPWWLSW